MNRAWGFLRGIAALAVTGALLGWAKKLRWPIVILVGLVLAAVYAVATSWVLLTAWVFHSSGSWQLALGSASGLWLLHFLARCSLNVRRGASRTLRDAVVGLWRCHKLRKGYPRAAARTKLLSAPDAREELAPAGNWRPMARGDVQVYLGWGTVGRTRTELLQALARLPQQFNAARAIEVPIRGHYAGSDVLIQWGDDLARLWTVGEIWELVQQRGVKPGQIPVGVSETGELVTVEANKSLLVGGMTSMGKSSLVWSFVVGCLIVGYRVRLHVLDPKGGIEFGGLKALLGQAGGQLTVHGYVDDDAVARSDQAYAPGGFWAEVRRIMDSKEAHTQRLGVRQLALGGETHGELDVLIVDELLSVVNDPHFRQQRSDHVLQRVAFRGRASNCMAIVCTQDGTKDVVGPMRPLIPQRVAFKTEGPDATDVILREGATRAGATAHLLDLTHDKGVVFIAADDSDQMVRARIGFVSDAEAAVIATGRIPDFGAAVADGTREASVYEGVANQDLEHDGVLYPAGTLMYVGSGFDAPTRFAAHQVAEDKQWWAPWCDWMVVETFTRPSLGMSPRDQAFLAEEDRIRASRPVCNDTYNRGNPDRVRTVKGRRR